MVVKMPTYRLTANGLNSDIAKSSTNTLNSQNGEGALQVKVRSHKRIYLEPAVPILQ